MSRSREQVGGGDEDGASDVSGVTQSPRGAVEFMEEHTPGSKQGDAHCELPPDRAAPRVGLCGSPSARFLTP